MKEQVVCFHSLSGDIRPRMHARMAVVVIRARGIIRVESRRSIVVEDDCLLLVPPLHLYGLQSLPGSESSPITVLVEMQPRTADAVPQLPALLGEPNLIDSWTALVGEHQQPIDSVERSSAFRSLITVSIARSTPIPPARANGWIAPLLLLRDYMRLHLNESIPTRTIVEMSGLTGSHCIRAFHQQFGLPPHAYHVQLRLAAACELLAQGQRVATVAFDCGFADQSHLSRKFKEAYGLAPTAWAASLAKTDMKASRSRSDMIRMTRRFQPTALPRR